MSRPIAVGDMIHGHVAGYFGRDYYNCARIEALGSDWVVMRTLGYDAYAVASTPNDPNGLWRELLHARDEFEVWFCDHPRPESVE